MRKKIEVNREEVNGKEVKQLTEGEKQMETLESVYTKMVRRLSYLKDRDTTDTLMDYQDALQQAMVYCLGKQVDNPRHYLRKAVAMNMRLNRQQEYRYQLTDQNFESEVFAYPLGEVLQAKEAIGKLLTTEEANVLTFYGEGMTYREINPEDPKAAQRIMIKAAKKIDSLRLAFLYDSKVAAYQGKQGKVDVKWDSEVIHKKEVKPNVAVNRRYLCLDQNKPKTKTLPANYQGDMVVIRKEVKRSSLTCASELYQDKEVMLNGQYMSSKLPPFENNKEVQYLYKNREQYRQMIVKESTIVKEQRSTPVFSYGRFTSLDGKYKNI